VIKTLQFRASKKAPEKREKGVDTFLSHPVEVSTHES